MRLVAYFARAIVAVTALIVLLSIIASSFVFFKELRILRRAALAEERASALAASKEALALVVPIDVIKERMRNLSFSSDDPKLLLHVSEIELVDFANAIKGRAKVVVGTSYLPDVRLHMLPAIYPSLSGNAGELRLSVEHIDLGEVSVRFRENEIGHIPRAVTNVASCLWSILRNLGEPASVPANIQVVIDPSSYVPPTSIAMGGASVTFGFSVQPIAISLVPKELAAFVTRNYLLVVASPVQ